MSDLLDDSIKSLTSLGLSVNQAKIYLSILKTGRATAKTISKTSRIAREDVYRALLSLQKLGLVTKHLTKPAMYEAIKPKDAIAYLLRLKERERSELQEKAKQALKDLSKIMSEHGFIMTEETITCVSNEESPQMITDALKKTTHSICYTTRYNLFLRVMNDPELYSVVKEMKKAVHRGVKIRMVLNKAENEKPISALSFQNQNATALTRHPNFECRYASIPVECIIILLDSEKCVIEMSTEHNVLLTPVLWSNNPVLVALCSLYFETVWNSGAEPEANPRRHQSQN